jgi:2-polyprenyl-3-methyl-5-hydroxy-6-metoxy-1,4-benzoquinol methylase
MSTIVLTDRQFREREYFDEWVSRQQILEVNFDLVDALETRPWNPYWYLAEVVKGMYTSPSQRLLDFGCGFGYYALNFRKVGYEVFGFDISASNIATARNLAQRYNLVERTHFDVGTAETVHYPSDQFDVIVGVDILHHVDIEPSIRECHRLLKPGGVAVFKEPIAVPIFDTLRNTSAGRALCSTQKSFERCITDDERKLTTDDVKTIASIFPDLTIQRFRLCSRLDAFWRHLRSPTHAAVQRKLERFDQTCLQLLPFLRRFGGEVVMTMRKS